MQILQFNHTIRTFISIQSASVLLAGDDRFSCEIVDHVTRHVLQGSRYQNAFHGTVSWLFRPSRAFLVLLSTFCQDFSTRRTFRREKESGGNEISRHYCRSKKHESIMAIINFPIKNDCATINYDLSNVILTEAKYKN